MSTSLQMRCSGSDVSFIRVGCSSAFVVFSSYPLHNSMRILLRLLCFAPVPSITSLTKAPSSASFSQLQKQIIDLATTHFVHLPVRPPAEDLAQVPSNLPSFLGDTAASRYDSHVKQGPLGSLILRQTSAYCLHSTHSFETYHVPRLRSVSVQSGSPL